MTMEYVDIYDSSMRKTEPFTAKKYDAHKLGLWHKTIHCWIVKDPNKILFQLRSPKGSFGNLFDVTAAGHIQAGEEIKDGIRELKEELGLDVSIDDLTFIGIYKQCVFRDEDSYDNKEFSYNYLYKCNKELKNYLLQEEEVKGLYEMDIDEGLKFFAGEIDGIEINGVVLTENGLVEDSRIIRIPNMAMSHERCIITKHYLKVLIMAKRFLAGEKYLAI